MKPLTLAIVGRANVGKSTLFNGLTRSRQALVNDQPGVTRDRLYGQGIIEDIPYQFIDTCGIAGEQAESLVDAMESQLAQAVQEAQAVLFVVDAKVGLLPEDQRIADDLRRKEKKVYLVVNKTDGMEPNIACSDFYQLGFDSVFAVAAAHRRGLIHMMTQIGHEHGLVRQEEVLPPAPKNLGIKISVLGRPNVGKSTLINRLLQEERVVVFDSPGTTRDSIYIPMERHGKRYTLIDTAGIRRQNRVYEALEKFTVVKSFQAMMDADCVLLVLDGHDEEIFDQDLNLLRQALKAGRSCVILINKWDGMPAEHKEAYKKALKANLQFAPNLRIHTISALHGTGVGDIFDLVEQAYAQSNQDLSTNFLSQILEKAIMAHAPPLSRGRRIKLKYAHCVGHNPLRILIHGNQTEALSDHYKKYLHNFFAKSLKLVGANLFIDYRTSDNPYQGRRNKLTARQLMKKKRLMKHVKKSKKRS